MNDQIEHHIDMLLQEEGLPANVRQRAAHFIQSGDLTQLMELPLDPEEMIQAGRVLICAPSDNPSFASRQHAPTLSPSTRERLRGLAEAEGEHAEAALFILIQDLKARAFNRALADAKKTSD